MTAITFASVKRSAVLKGACTECGRKRTRTATVENTINPFNRNSDGLPKSRAEVTVDVERQLAEIKAQPFVCASCIKARRGW